MTPTKDFQSTMLITVPHMDDCVLGCGGLLALLPDKDKVHVCYVTDGARSPAPVFPWRDQVSPDLCEIRRAEARAAMIYLGLLVENLHFLDLPDSQLQQHKQELSAGLLMLIKAINPEHIFVPFRYDRHPDHLALNQVVTDAVRNGTIRAQLIEYFVYHRWRLLPAGDVRHYIKSDQLMVVDIVAISHQKRTALDCFTSQTTLFYSWQTRPNLTPQLLDEVSRASEMFLKYNPTLPGTTIFKALGWWIIIAHHLEPFLKRNKDRVVALVKRGLYG